MRIGVLATGGTIACHGKPLRPLAVTEFAGAVDRLLTPALQAQFTDLDLVFLPALDFPGGSLDSTNLQPADWVTIATAIVTGYEAVDGWVVLHGTDSMDFSAGALSFLLNDWDERGIAVAQLSKPVVLTGSQLPLLADTPDGWVLRANTDAYQNFCGAVAAVYRGVPEVCVYFGDKLMRGNRAVKSHANQFDAFASPNYPLLGQGGVQMQIDPSHILPGPTHQASSLDDEPVRAQLLDQLEQLKARIGEARVMRFSAFPAPFSDRTNLIADLLQACIDTGVGGIVLESYGEGNFPAGATASQTGASRAVLKRAIEQGVVVIDCTQVGAGKVEQLAYAAGTWLNEVGALPAMDMTVMACLTKLTVVKAKAALRGWDENVLSRLLQLDLVGECAMRSRLVPHSNPELLPRARLAALDGSAYLRNDEYAGPVLETDDGRVLWRLLRDEADEEAQLPGKLALNDDGVARFRGRDGTVLWRMAGTLLELAGSYRAGNLCLRLEGDDEVLLYQQAAD
ncbi:MAG: asparaginase [Pseudomonadota bacterium]